jgi:hypothetical protein
VLCWHLTTRASVPSIRTCALILGCALLWLTITVLAAAQTNQPSVNFGSVPRWLTQFRVESNEERVMIALGLVRVIERHSDEFAAELIAKLETSSRTTDLRKVPVDELRQGIQEILRHLVSSHSPKCGSRFRTLVWWVSRLR